MKLDFENLQICATTQKIINTITLIDTNECYLTHPLIMLFNENELLEDNASIFTSAPL